ncbi:MAG: hypothetical protein Q9174_004062 [Haloplaca sp. 1 TL-2023]
MSIQAVAQATSTASSSLTVTTNLFDPPTGACNLALHITGLQTVGRNASQQTSSAEYAAEVVSNPDIAGIGVLVAFLATAYGIFVWMLVAYVRGLLPEPLLGQVDKFVFKRSALERTRRPWWQNAVEQSIVTYADLQIATGVGILVAACSTMRSLSVYHLQVAIYLAWMSSNTHLTAISLLQIEYRENKSKSIARRLRLGGMFILGVFLLVALVPTTSYNWLLIVTQSQNTDDSAGRSRGRDQSAAGIPARCFWQSEYTGGRTADAAWSFIILIFSYVWKGLLLFQRSHQAVKGSSRRRVLQPLRRSLDRLVIRARQIRRHEGRRRHVLRYKAVFCVYLAAWAVFELAQSFVMSLWICGAGLVWGSFQILVPRRRLPSQVLEDENSWGFGQILPILLLGVPILSFAQGYAVQKAENDRKNHLHDTPSLHPSSEFELMNRNTDEALAIVPNDTERNAEAPATSNAPTPSTRGASNASDRSEDNTIRRSDRPPPWRDDSRIYASRFIIFAFWGSQVGILALATFIVAYRGLFLPLGTLVYSETQQTLLTDSWIWLIVGCTISMYVLVAIALLVCGAIFSSLFVVDDDDRGDRGEVGDDGRVESDDGEPGHVGDALYEHAFDSTYVALDYYHPPLEHMVNSNNAESSEAEVSTRSANTAKPATEQPSTDPSNENATHSKTTAAPTRGHTTESDDERNYLFHVAMTLSHDPMISRILSVPPSLTFEKFHQVLQIAFGWAECHMHTFNIETELNKHGFLQPVLILQRTFGYDEDDLGIWPKAQNEGNWTLRDVFERKEWETEDGGKTTGEIHVRYEHDMGDGWNHQIVLLGRAEKELHKVLGGGEDTPVLCIGGEGHPCAEDCGGSVGWDDLKKTFKKQKGDKYLKDWYKKECHNGDPKGLDPYKWDILDVNDQLAELGK